jgi:hypothetical protein
MTIQDWISNAKVPFFGTDRTAVTWEDRPWVEGPTEYLLSEEEAEVIERTRAERAK